MSYECVAAAYIGRNRGNIDYLFPLGIYKNKTLNNYVHGFFYNDVRVMYAGIQTSGGYYYGVKYVSQAGQDFSAFSAFSSISAMFDKMNSLSQGADFHINYVPTDTKHCVIHADADILRIYQNSNYITISSYDDITGLPVVYNNGR